MSLRVIQGEIVACVRCPRLIAHGREVARVKRRAYRDEEYWGRPVPSFGDPAAKLLIVGLAPGAHGANRTGRMFTGDSSGDFLYRALHQTGFASQPHSTHRKDGLELRSVWITASAHCAPPDNKPSPDELRACRPYLERELAALRNLRCVVALGRIAFDAYTGVAGLDRLAFSHGAEYSTDGPALLASYHPSRQNTQTGRLTEPMFRAVFERARVIVEER
jgi:uracil-DNA glycosylase family 4